mgnify:CR=1 FL=1
MIVAIPCMSESQTGRISERLARSPFFAIADTSRQEVRFINNHFSTLGSGAGREMIAFMKASGIETIMTHEIGLKVQQLAVENKIGLLLLPDTITRVDQVLNHLKISSNE